MSIVLYNGTYINIDDLVREIKIIMVNNNLSTIEIYLSHVKDPLTLISKGLLPDLDSILIPINNFGIEDMIINESLIRRLLFQDLLDEVTPEETSFWYDQSFDIKRLYSSCEWRYSTLKYYQEKYIPMGDSLPMLLYYPDQVYSDTLHPKTDMSLYRQPVQKTMNDVKFAIPVVRYSSGMKRGLFYGECDNCCGTYYYLESESKTLLGYNTSATFRNKAEAYIALIGNTKYHADAIIFDRNQYNDDLMYTPLEIYDLFKRKGINSYIDKFSYEDIIKLPQRKRYLGHWLHLYAVEDGLDTDLCKAAAAKGIDILIFTHMTGSYQVVSELVDTRERITSFEHLIYT